ncbi:MAG: glycosyltransferase family protein [Pseudomonadota bacterium]|nr:glycosyltransferase family protein [Pseudomonadota bacterium]
MGVTIRIVCATRENSADFATKTALGRSLALYRWPFIELRLFPNNTAGLPEVYNTVLRESVGRPAILLFIHDDIHLLDFFWPERLVGGLNNFDIIGLAGNKRRVPRQPSWMFLDDKFTRDAAENLSGVVSHGRNWPALGINYYGAPGVEVKIMDGLLLAAHSETLLSRDVRFDENFDFHFYDLDFCRRAEFRKLRMGTWPIQVMHESDGAFGTPGWHRGYEKYLAKWKM